MDRTMEHQHATPDMTGKLFDNPHVETTDEGYDMRFPMLEDSLADQYLDLIAGIMAL
jgi:hypothetical protein